MKLPRFLDNTAMAALAAGAVAAVLIKLVDTLANWLFL